PRSLDFGLVEAGASLDRFGGVIGAAADGVVSVSIQQDTSGGRFAVTEIRIFDVEPVDPSEGGGKALVFELVMVGNTDGSAPVQGTAGQAVAAVVTFAAPADAPGERFTAGLACSGDWLCGGSLLPITARVTGVATDLVWGLANPFGILANHKSVDDPFQGNWF